MIYGTRGEHANHDTTDAVTIKMKNIWELQQLIMKTNSIEIWVKLILYNSVTRVLSSKYDILIDNIQMLYEPIYLFIKLHD